MLKDPGSRQPTAFVELVAGRGDKPAEDGETPPAIGGSVLLEQLAALPSELELQGKPSLRINHFGFLDVALSQKRLGFDVDCYWARASDRGGLAALGIVRVSLQVDAQAAELFAVVAAGGATAPGGRR